MLAIKTFIVLLLFFIYPITAFNFIFPKYFTGVTGGLTCRYRHAKIAFIVISEDPTLKLETSIVSAKIVTFGKKFYLVGKIRSFLRPFLYFKIFHNCYLLNKNNYKRVYVVAVPKKYITRSRKLTFFNVKKIELSKLPGKLIKHAVIPRG